MSNAPFHWTLREAMGKLPEQTPEHLRFTTMFQRGNLSIELYAPRGIDTQQPHTQDELYIVMAGSGEFINGAVRHRFAPGDAIFVPAGVPHRFENFSDDFATWVIFYGPPGGETIA